MGKSRQEVDLAARYENRIKPTEREKRPHQRLTFKQRQAFAMEKHNEERKKAYQFETEGRYYEEVRKGGARQAGAEPDGPHDKDPWSSGP